ncbi:MAG TPA: dihydrodipicolinate synthase family protein [Terriglobales bacterium]|nr:dihydrodipicolinate synthase family protein [Terriglobales bacterium]
MLLHGIFPPITTPFYSDGSVYYKKLEQNVEHYSRTPIAGIVIQGSTGEAVMLSDQEKKDVFRVAREAAAPEKVMIAGVGIESAVETVKFAEYAAELGYDVAMVRTPHYYKMAMTNAAMLAFYRTVADRSPLPVIIYNFPQATGYDIPVEVVVELADHPNIISIKESAGNLEKTKALVEGTRHVKRSVQVTESFEAVTGRMLKQAQSAVAVGELVSAGALAGTAKPSSSAVQMVGSLKTRQKEVGFQVMVGAAHQLLQSLEVGAVGAILAFADPVPTACFEIYQAWKERADEIAREKQDRITAAAKYVVGTLSIAGVKYAMDLNGYYGGPSRLPLLSLTAEQKGEVEKLMAGIRN